MKKAIYLLVLIFSFMFVVGCDSNETEEPSINNNEQIYNSFKGEFNKYQLDIADADKLVSEVSVSYTIFSLSDKELGKAKSDSVIKICNSPFYVEATTNVNYEPTKKFIYTFENNKYYQNEIIDDTNIVTSYIDDFDNLDIGDSDEIVDFSFNYEKGTAEYKDGEYTFIQTYKDAIDMQEDVYLADLYKEFGIALSSVLNSNVETKFKFENEQLYMSFEFDLEVVINGSINKMNAFISYRFKVEDFEMIDISNHEKIFVDICDVNEYSILDKYYQINYNYHNRVLKYRFNKGFYYLKSNEIDDNSSSFEVLDKNGTPIEINKLVDVSEEFELSTVFEIKQDGDYYISFRGCYQSICISEFDINRFKETNINFGEDISYSLNDKEYLNVKIDDDIKEFGYVMIENKSEHSIKYIGNYSFQVNEIKPGELDFLRFDLENNILIFVGDDNSKNITVNVSYQNVKYDDKFEEFEEITTEPSKDLLILQRSMVGKKFKLTVTKTGYYQFNCSYNDTNKPISFMIQQYEGEHYLNDGSNRYLLTPGTYIITPVNSFSQNEYEYGYASYSVEYLEE